jgi:hypothetical protein
VGKSVALNEVDRLFRRLVEVLAAGGTERLTDPIEIPALYQELIPYRANRARLRLDSHQDYEMALLRLLAGESGYVEVEPAEVAQALADEVRAIHPHPGAFRSFSDARARLSIQAVRTILEATERFAPAPPAPPSTGAPAVGVSAAPGPGLCPQCDRSLPTGRVVKFCPHCGDDVKVRQCPQCGTQLDIDWRHCITCGYRVS